MTSKEIFDLFSRFENSSMKSMKLSSGDFSLELNKADVPVEHAPTAPVAPNASPPPLLPVETTKSVHPWWVPSTPHQPPVVNPLSQLAARFARVKLSV